MSGKFPGVYKEPFTRDYARLHQKITKEACVQLDEKGYVVIDDCFGHGWASALLEEMRWLNDHDHFKPNKTQFALTQKGTDGKPQAFHFVKPHIFEEEYYESLMECMQSTSTEGCVELLKSHETHLENVKRNVPLYNFIKRLRDVRAMNNEDPRYLG
ncbi:hypothetical protein JG687_00004246 [Phytophthora cactorum]|uniref:Uncharacterized protein n=1 Tax=Phytophthora cactorum TaxID=29920 RepID=A0A8T1URR2_9STRA|nr:hypothetical protein JG687_00004246 [Phytophthora cactorum]